MKYALILFTGLFLMGCAGTPTTRALNGLAIACDSYQATLSALAVRRAQRTLSESTIRTVEGVRAIVTPVCLVKDPTDPVAALNEIEAHVAKLITLKGSR